ncbi:flagellar basal body-associated protein FliL [Psychromonas sp. CNPT3]|uniref:flagellar basal body-associated protein FliL n=1 Tax=Psychromonas sp. CNPT3 TaxID=314282 RepID=UPI00006E954A|nr:flagellar basal body-associated protein FliL [Psychromonas sp. CNPT3]AGH80234.1 flagellar basal body-associated protein FliL [Psychromonas sp. CNPT3]
MKKILLCLFCFSLSLFSPAILADEEGEVKNDYQYFLLEPDIITNYIKIGKRIGFVRISVDLMVNSQSDYELLERHEPLIRDRIISIFGEQNEDKVKSISERELIRKHCLEDVNNLLFAETGTKPIKELIFTKYLYQ